MSSLSPVGRSAAAPKHDRVSLCSFTFSDGRRCRTPRVRNHPHFCFYHAQKHARARTAKKLAKDLTYFFSGEYLSACDLSTAMARLIPAVVRGDVKPKTAHTVAYLVQTLVQAIHIAQHEYTNAFGTDGWRKAIRNAVRQNSNYRFPPPPESNESDHSESLQLQPQPQPQPAAAALARPGIYPHPVGRGEILSSTGATSPAQPQTQAPQPARSPHAAPIPTPESVAAPPAPPALTPQSVSVPHTPLPATGAEFFQHIMARSEPVPTEGPDAVGRREAFPSASPPQPAARPVEPPANCHCSSQPAANPVNRLPEHSEEPAFSESRADLSQTISAPQQTPSPIPAPAPPSPPRPTPTRDPYAVHFDHNYRLLIDGKPF